MSNPQLSKSPFIEVALEAVKKIQTPLLLYGIVESVLLISLLITGREIPSALVPIVYALPVLIVIIVLAHSILEYTKQRGEQSKTLDSTKSAACRVFARSDSSEFRTYVEDLMLKAHHVVLIGTGLNILHQDPFAWALMSRAADAEQSCHLEIYLADPASPAVETRLAEEELGKIKPPITRSGLYNRLNTLLKRWEDLNHPDTISINLFTHYPTLALMIVDDEYFIYPYVYATLGNFSPVLHFSKDRPSDKRVIEFLDEHYRNVKKGAVKAKTAFDIRSGGYRSTEDLYPFALYFVPPADSELYQFGTQILGYDVREQRSRRSQWREQVGGARDFGFHLTLSDALYFLSETEVDAVWAEVKFLAEDFKPFDLTDLRLEQGFPDENSISIVMEDPSGNLEALHHELVQRVYRRATASNYSLGLVRPVRDPDMRRARLMIEKYKAPYILQRFHPHFTLLTNVAEERSELFQKLNDDFSKSVQRRTMRVERLAMMTYSRDRKRWTIKGETNLGRLDT